MTDPGPLYGLSPWTISLFGEAESWELCFLTELGVVKTHFNRRLLQVASQPVYVPVHSARLLFVCLFGINSFLTSWIMNQDPDLFSRRCCSFKMQTSDGLLKDLYRRRPTICGVSSVISVGEGRSWSAWYYQSIPHLMFRTFPLFFSNTVAAFCPYRSLMA